MAITIPVAHDFICPWCWVGFLQAQRLRREFDVEFEWLGYELFPDALEWPESAAPDPAVNPRPHRLTRFELMLVAEGIEMPSAPRPSKMRTHNAHEAVEYAKTEGAADAIIEALYRAYWERGETIDDPDVIERLATGIVQNLPALRDALTTRRYQDRIVGFDDDAYASGVFYVPTFFIGEERLAEQPYSRLRAALLAVQGESVRAPIYASLPELSSSPDRPYVFVNMVTTIDGKTVSGGREDSVIDLGSALDHELMRRIEASADAIMVGAQTIRATTPAWRPQSRIRIAVTRSGDLPTQARFFEENAFLAVSGDSDLEPFGETRLLKTGVEKIDFRELLRILRQTHGVNRLLVSGGSELNAELLALDLVDELFWTIAPKVKLGRNLPTYAGGDPLPRSGLLGFELVEHHVVGNEVFLRYRRARVEDDRSE